MSILLETTLGDVVIDLDVDGSPHLCKNVLKLAKARYYTNSLVYNVQPGRFCQLGDPRGDGSGGCSIYGLIDSVRSGGNGADVTKSDRRFLRSEGRALTRTELRERGRLVASEMGGVGDTVGSQLLLTVDGGRDGRALDDGAGGGGGGGGGGGASYRSIGVVSEDDGDVLERINGLYCDGDGRPFADVRVVRALVLDDPFDDPAGMEEVLEARGVTLEGGESPGGGGDDGDGAAPRLASASPQWDRPAEEAVERRIGADVALAEEDEDAAGERDEALRRKEDKSRAVVLEMLGDLPSADAAAPDDVLFVCKLNAVTDDEDLELIFSRFDPKARAEIIRDPDTGDSLCYAFVEFTTKERCNEAYFKMNNALVDDRRIKVDFSQSVAKVWNRFAQHRRGGGGGGGGRGEGGGRGGGRGRGGGGRGYGGRGSSSKPAPYLQSGHGGAPPPRSASGGIPVAKYTRPIGVPAPSARPADRDRRDGGSAGRSASPADDARRRHGRGSRGRHRKASRSPERSRSRSRSRIRSRSRSRSDSDSDSDVRSRSRSRDRKRHRKKDDKRRHRRHGENRGSSSSRRHRHRDGRSDERLTKEDDHRASGRRRDNDRDRNRDRDRERHHSHGGKGDSKRRKRSKRSPSCSRSRSRERSKKH